MALAGAAAVGWLARAFHAPTAGRMQRRPPREGASANRGTKIKAVSKVRGLLPEPSTRTAGSSTGAKTKARRNARELKERLER
jgi:hypothetical protein